jgi:hypothetical protein
LAVFEKFLRRDVMFGKPAVLPRAEKVLDVIGAPINEISRHAIRVNEVVNAPADFAREIFHALQLLRLIQKPAPSMSNSGFISPPGAASAILRPSLANLETGRFVAYAARHESGAGTN